MTKNDPAQLYALMLKTASSVDKKVLWVADENMPADQIGLLSSIHNLTFICNRFDLTQQAEPLLGKNKASVLFSDFDFSNIASQEPLFDIIYYRISKERPVTHWVLTQLSRLLAPNGQLIIAGLKNEGIKSTFEKVREAFSLEGKLKKHGALYVAQLNASNIRPAQAKALDHKNYSSIQKIAEAFNGTVYSKPGLYGWDKIDIGSQLLAQEFQTFIAGPALKKENRLNTALDLGCGYGYLSLAMHAANIQNITATDNCAAAVSLCEYNLRENGATSFNVVADDCGSSLQKKVDLILCNPPFHQGFSIDAGLTEKFLYNAARLLSRDGHALFVVNAFIPIEKLALKHFKQCLTLSNNKQFKVLALNH